MLRTIVAAVALTLAAPAAAHAADFDTTMGRLAAHQAQGWKDNELPVAELEARIAAGGRVYVSCSVIADLGYRAARAAGLPARHVSVLTRNPFDGYNDGHAMLEVRLGGRWVLYDLTMDRVAVDARGRRVGLARQVRARRKLWRKVAHDPGRWSLVGLDAGGLASMRRVLAMGADRWYRHIMGVALVETAPGVYAYHGAGRREAWIDAVWPGHYQWVPAARWRALNE